MAGIATAWNVLILGPMLNSLMALNVVLQNFGITIIIFTIVVRLIMLPLNLRQIRTTQAMSTLKPKLEEMQKKYKDPRRRSQETMKLYKEQGLSPLGCLGPMLIQFPIWIALYQSVTQAMAATPENLLSLSQRLYSWSFLHEMVPVESHFLWLSLAQPDPYPILALLVGVSTWVQQKMMTVSTADPRQSSMNNMMLWMMPAMFALWTLYFPSGLALYWLTSNLVGIFIQYLVTGWGGLQIKGLLARRQAPSPAVGGGTPSSNKATTSVPPPSTTTDSFTSKEEKGIAYGDYRGKREIRRRGRRHRPRSPGPPAGEGGDRGPQQG